MDRNQAIDHFKPQASKFPNKIFKIPMQQIVDPKAIAPEFNNFFANFGINLAKSIPKVTKSSIIYGDQFGFRTINHSTALHAQLLLIIDQQDCLLLAASGIFLDLSRESLNHFNPIRVINVKFPLQPHQKYNITQYGELGFS